MTTKPPPKTKQTINLYGFQKEGVSAIVDAFCDPNRGGYVLCDEMGLGKTPQALASIQALVTKRSLSLIHI